MDLFGVEIVLDFHCSNLNVVVLLSSNQAEGKKRMKAIGKVEVPQEAFMAVLKLEKEVI
ncbi:hypothetical protein ACLOJK_013854 [Asimina triloba]